MKNYTKMIYVCLLSAALFLPSQIYADENIEELKAQINALQARVNQLEANKTSQPYGFFGARRSAWDPFAEMQRMQQEMDRMFQHSFSQLGAGDDRGVFSSDMNFEYEVDMKENDKSYEIVFDMTGLDKDKVDVQINDKSITVRGEQSVQEENQNQSGYFQTSSFGLFMKTIPVPSDADTSQVKTEKKDDKLVITLPKRST